MNDPVQKAADDQAQLTKNSTPTLADDVEEFEEKQDDFQAAYNAGGHFKEQLENIAKGWPHAAEASRGKEKAVEQMVEIPNTPEVGKEVEGYVEKIEKEAELQQTVTDDYHQILVGPASSQKPQVKIPLTDDQIQAGLHHKVWEAIRWLAVWCLRQIKVIHRHS